MNRRKTKSVYIGNVEVGSDAPVTVQSMTNTNTHNVEETVSQIKELEDAGCDIIRVAVPDLKACDALRDIINQINIPLVSDIHFNHKLALKAIERGTDALRINPGNIGSEEKVREVVYAASQSGIPIRIGVNSGSLEHSILEKYNGISPEGMVESALEHIKLCEKIGFTDIIISLKSSDVLQTIKAYRMMAEKNSYPLHLGVTEAGTYKSGIIKSAVGIGSLLLEGIGDTIRISLTAPPVQEVLSGISILKALKLREGVEIISCPTCGRCEIDIFSLASRAEKELSDISEPLKIAIMGCVVNGPGEAKDADFGIAGGKKSGLIFRLGEPIKKVNEDELLSSLKEEIHSYLKGNSN